MSDLETQLVEMGENNRQLRIDNLLFRARIAELTAELSKHKRVTFMLAFPHLHSERDPGYMDHSPMETCRRLYEPQEDTCHNESLTIAETAPATTAPGIPRDRA